MRFVRRPGALPALIAAVLALAPRLAHAQDAGGLRDFCAERPGRATPPCIVDVGRVMIEVDGLDLTRNRDAGLTQTSLVALSPHLRFGLTPNLEWGVNFTPFTETRVRGDPAARATTRGTGDTTLDLKFSLLNPGGAGPSVAILPFVSLPTAQHGLGAGGFQGGVIAPVALALPSGFSLSLAPELDVVRNGEGGVRPLYVSAISLGHALTPQLSGAVELWASAEHAPDGWEKHATADVALAWIPKARPNLQLDAGVNLGLNHSAPDVQAYVGASRRF
ncbi:transporter [Phenylobacterium sp.]|uniref:transporter n=1 Tax=Phenylobacterium sp. TaxID=1871053 RepID=UPI002DF13C71|nr:transporter [Phenylobacterium sp.]